MTRQERDRVECIRSQFINILSHELRTPLATSSGYVQMLLSDTFGPLSSDQKEKLKSERKERRKGRHMMGPGYGFLDFNELNIDSEITMNKRDNNDRNGFCRDN